ncbi:aminoglycoside N(3)-acetyltransferase [Nonomuraea sediminis]|uniref:aminoglycoside N(3)-acetyltransferase n=1 Tax=Nonomuraea sediminis TaxID=2835864 RepID=UPI001BDD45AA|nr:AAC(3) family N-acetyltransferase [Nonomuraea sediminis]
MDLAEDLQRLGLTEGRIVLLHASLAGMGYIPGGAATVAETILDVLGPSGTLVVSTSTPENSDTSRAHLRKVSGLSEQDVLAFRAEMPPFHIRTSAASTGRIADYVRTRRGSIRSAHPQTSFAATGPHAAHLMAGHPLTSHLGPDSPLGKLYALGASVLLIGVGYGACSALHLAEYLYRPDPPRRVYRCVMQVDGLSQWVTYQDVVLDDSDFPWIGRELDRHTDVRRGKVARAWARLMPMTLSVDTARRWLAVHR